MSTMKSVVGGELARQRVVGGELARQRVVGGELARQRVYEGEPPGALDARIDARQRIKVCGLTREEDARLALELGAWALGFVHYAASPRTIEASRVRQLLSSLEIPEDTLSVGVFVNAEPGEVMDFVEGSGINAIQLHGDERPEYCSRLRELLPKVGLIKAFRPRGMETLDEIARYRSTCDLVLLDAHVENHYGGTGTLGDWELARKAAGRTPVVLAGGLRPENVAAAAATVRPYAVDVSSGVESAPGFKCALKLRSFFRSAHSTIEGGDR